MGKYKWAIAAGAVFILLALFCYRKPSVDEVAYDSLLWDLSKTDSLLVPHHCGDVHSEILRNHLDGHVVSVIHRNDAPELILRHPLHRNRHGIILALIIPEEPVRYLSIYDSGWLPLLQSPLHSLINPSLDVFLIFLCHGFPPSSACNPCRFSEEPLSP